MGFAGGLDDADSDYSDYSDYGDSLTLIAIFGGTELQRRQNKTVLLPKQGTNRAGFRAFVHILGRKKIKVVNTGKTKIIGVIVCRLGRYIGSNEFNEFGADGSSCRIPLFAAS